MRPPAAVERGEGPAALEAARGRRGPSRLAEVTPQARPFLFPSIRTPL